MPNTPRLGPLLALAVVAAGGCRAAAADPPAKLADLLADARDRRERRFSARLERLSAIDLSTSSSRLPSTTERRNAVVIARPKLSASPSSSASCRAQRLDISEAQLSKFRCHAEPRSPSMGRPRRVLPSLLAGRGWGAG